MTEKIPFAELIDHQAKYIKLLETRCENLQTQCDHQQSLLGEFKRALDDTMYLLEQRWLLDKEKP